MGHKKSRLNSLPSTSNHYPTLGTGNDQEQFVITPEIFQLLQSFNKSGIHPIIVLDLHHRPRKYEGLLLCGAVFLKRKGSSLERISSSKLIKFGFQLTKTMEDAIDANWRHFNAQKHKGVASNHHTVPSFATSVISDDHFEFSAPKAKWTVLGGRNMVDVDCKESKPESRDILSWIGERASDMTSLLKTFGIPLTFDVSKLVKELLEDPGKDPAKAVSCGVGVFLLLGFGISKRSSPCANWIINAVAISSVVVFFWKLIYPLPFAYILCFVAVCAVFSVLYYLIVVIGKKKRSSPG